MEHSQPLMGCRAGACRQGGCEEGSSGAGPWWATGDWLQTASHPTSLMSQGTCRSSAGARVSIDIYMLVGRRVFKLDVPGIYFAIILSMHLLNKGKGSLDSRGT